MAHKAQLSLLDVVESDSFEIKSLFERVRAMIRFIRASPDRRSMFAKIQRERLNGIADVGAAIDDLDDEEEEKDRVWYVPRTTREYRDYMTEKAAAQQKPLLLILDVKTRWMTAFYMLERFVFLFDDVMEFALRGGFDDYDTRENGALVLPSECTTLRCFVDALAPLADFVRVSEGQKYVTMAWVVPLYARVLQCLRSAARGRVEEEEFRRELTASLERRLGYLLSTPNLALAASALHPAFARLHFISSTMRRIVWEALTQTSLEFGELNDESDFRSDDDASIDPLDVIRGPRISQARSSSLLGELRRLLERCTKEDVGLKEALSLAGTEKYDPIVWWRAVEATKQYQSIIHIGRIILGVPGTSAPSERVFSGNVWCERHSTSTSNECYRWRRYCF